MKKKKKSIDNSTDYAYAVSQRVEKVWPKLPPNIQAAIIALIGTDY